MQFKIDSLPHHMRFMKIKNELYLFIGCGGGEGIPNKLVCNKIKYNSLKF